MRNGIAWTTPFLVEKALADPLIQARPPSSQKSQKPNAMDNEICVRPPPGTENGHAQARCVFIFGLLIGGRNQPGIHVLVIEIGGHKTRPILLPYRLMWLQSMTSDANSTCAVRVEGQSQT